MKRIAIILATLLATAAQADEWHGPDKTAHAIGGAAIGVAATAWTKDWRWGCGLATAAGVAKEVADHYTPGRTVSAKDAIVTAAAGCLAAGGTQLLIVPTDKGARFVWSVKF